MHQAFIGFFRGTFGEKTDGGIFEEGNKEDNNEDERDSEQVEKYEFKIRD